VEVAAPAPAEFLEAWEGQDVAAPPAREFQAITHTSLHGKTFISKV